MTQRPFYETGIVRIYIVENLTSKKYIVYKEAVSRYDDAENIAEDFVFETPLTLLKEADTWSVATKFLSEFCPAGNELSRTKDELVYLDNKKQENYFCHLLAYGGEKAAQKGEILNKQYRK